MEELISNPIEAILAHGKEVEVGGKETIEVRNFDYTFDMDTIINIEPTETILRELTRFWDKRDGQWYAGYAYRILNRLPYVVKELTRDPNSRRAIISGITEDSCLMSIQFLPRHGILDVIATFRSWDLINWAPLDLHMLSEVAFFITQRTNTKLGKLCVNAGSAHIYTKDL